MRIEPQSLGQAGDRASRLPTLSSKFVAVQPGIPGDRGETTMTNQTPRLLSWPKVRERCGGLSRTTIWKLRVAGDFPAPVTLSPGRVAWREADIDGWLVSRTERAA